MGRSAPTTDLVTLGETMALLSAPRVGQLRRMPHLDLSTAGAESNVAVGLRRLGHQATWIGRVGDDEFGQLILANLRAEGVDVSRARVDHDAQTALMVKERRTEEVVRVRYYRSGYAGSRLEPDDLEEDVVAGARVLHVTGITPALSPSARAATWRAVELARRAGATVSVDLNYRAALWPPAEAAPELSHLASRADIVFAGDDELALVTGDHKDPGADAGGGPPTTSELAAAARQVGDDGAREVVVKLGPAGALYVRGTDVVEQSAVPVRAFDPVGAGDAFVAGYLSALLDGSDVPARLHRGCLTGAFAVSVAGDWEGLPGRGDLGLLGLRPGSTLR
ncbi:MAG TPA: sugar kinase [Acidimicrobiales bacterium]|nr:sugar kinase [Acidimicrobiales bacterium]